MNNSDLRNLVSETPAAEDSGMFATIIQGILVFSVAICGFGLYRNPDLARGWIPGLGASNAGIAAPAGPPFKLPPAALAAIADENTMQPGEPLTMQEEGFSNAFGMAADSMDPDATPEEKAAMAQDLRAVSQSNINMLKIGAALSGRPDIMDVKIYPGGKTSRAMATACIANEKGGGIGVDYDAAALTRVTNCYMTTNVERLCSSVQKQVLVDIIEHYFSSRDATLRRGRNAAADGKRAVRGDPKPADWLGEGPKTLAANFTRLVAQGYVSRSDFSWSLDDEFKKIANDTPVERRVCGPERS